MKDLLFLTNHLSEGFNESLITHKTDGHCKPTEIVRQRFTGMTVQHLQYLCGFKYYSII